MRRILFTANARMCHGYQVRTSLPTMSHLNIFLPIFLQVAMETHNVARLLAVHYYEKVNKYFYQDFCATSFCICLLVLLRTQVRRINY